MKNYFKLISIALFTLLFVACSSDDDAAPEPVNEEEVITTVIATFTSESGAQVILTSRDLDGEGPNGPETTISGAFSSSTSYTGAVEFRNELEDPYEDITVEVLEEALEHQVFYNYTSDLGMISYSDEDADGNPIGLNVSYETSSSASGTITITLRHEPNKSGAGVNEGDITNAGGETDVAVSFDVEVQ
jgi:predicted RNA binding protein with dsRBD fold (UPF0201 family)